jgi:hypothetical protein
MTTDEQSLDQHAWLTVADAAEAAGVSVRTLRRRIKDGDLSATMRPVRGKQALTIDGAELARFVEASGRSMPTGERRGGASASMSHRPVPPQRGAPQSELEIRVARMEAEAEAQRQAVALLTRQNEFLLGQNEFLQTIVERLTRALPEGRTEQEQEHKEAEAAEMPVPASTEAAEGARTPPERPSLWQRLFGRRREGTDG